MRLRIDGPCVLAYDRASERICCLIFFAAQTRSGLEAQSRLGRPGGRQKEEGVWGAGAPNPLIEAGLGGGRAAAAGGGERRRRAAGDGENPDLQIRKID